MKRRHTPIRTCVACRATDEKRDLLRVVRQPDCTVRYDPQGKLSGRGAYVCANANCIALAQRQKKLERSLKVGALPEALFIELNARAAAVMGVGDTHAITAGIRPVDDSATKRGMPSPGQESEAENV